MDAEGERPAIAMMPAPLKIAFNATVMGGALTGIARYAHELCRNLAALGQELHYFDGRYWRDSPPQPAAQGAFAPQRLLSDVPGMRTLARSVRQRWFARGCTRIRPQLYHDPAFIPYEFDGPLVITAHDVSWVRYPNAHPAGRVRFLNRTFPAALQRADRIIVDSAYVGRELQDLFGVDVRKVRVIPLGAGEAFRPLPRQRVEETCRRYGLESGGYVLTVGTLEPRKNLATLLRAVGCLPDVISPATPLVIAGMRGWNHGQMDRNIARLQEEGRVCLLGYLADSDLPAIYAGARMFVYPSLYEGFGLPPLEAMSMGTPVIVSNTSAMPEVVGEAGLQVNPRDEGSIANAIRRLHEDDALREALADSGMQRAARFCWERCAAETLAVYRELLA